MTERRSREKISSGMLVGGTAIFASRLSGLIRDILFAKYWGTGNALGAFFVAFTIPNLFRRIFGEGALSEAFIPLFTEKFSRDGRRAAFLYASNVITVAGITLLSIVGIGIGLTVVLRFLLPGEFAGLTVKLLPFLLPYTFFICLTGILAGILNSLNHFAYPSLAPVILNCSLIIAVVFICPRLGPSDYEKLSGLACAVMVAGILQILILFPVLIRFNFTFKFLPNFRSAQIKDLTRLVLPGVFSASVNQINVLCDRLFAGWLGGYAVTSLYFSERLVYLPIGVFAVALAAACLPELSRAFTEVKIEDMISSLFYALRLILYLTLPCVLILMMLGYSIVDLLYQRGNFDRESARQTISALMFYAPGIPAFAAVKILRTGFFCRKDTATPMKAGLICFLLNLILNLVLMFPLQQRGLALATTICSYVNVVILTVALFRVLNPYRLPLRDFFSSIFRTVCGLGGAGYAIWYLKGKILMETSHSLLYKLQLFFVPAVAGMLIYSGISIVLGANEPRELMSVLKTKLEKSPI